MRILHWFRKDLRLDDNTALSEAARDAGGDVVPFYASEPSLLARDDIAAARVRFVLDALAALDGSLRACGSTLARAHGEAVDTVPAAARASGADAVYWNDEYEPSLRARDEAVERALRAAGVRVRRFHDRLLVPPGEVRTQAGGPYTVFTPFRRACEALAVSAPHPAPARFAPHALPSPPFATLERLGFEPPASGPWPAGEAAARARLSAFVAGTDGPGLAAYATQRDLPAVRGTSRLSADLKFGTIGIRRVHAEVVAGADPNGPGGAARWEVAGGAQRPHHTAASDRPGSSDGAGGAADYVTELRWRDFYAHVLWHFPHVEHGCFRPAYDAIAWSGDETRFAAWRDGRTGYPIVDAGMRELLATGFMHNRVRMIVASFLTKDLLVDWRRGERHFMRHLLDGDLASNNGGWQWAAGTGTDAAPYFRIFHPVTQGERFDPDGAYVKRWCPELARVPASHVHRPWTAPPPLLAAAGVTLGGNWPQRVVDHAVQRERALAMYRAVRSSGP